MYSDDDMIMISALQHFLFCKRQCALIHLEQIWTENHLTASGRRLHEHVDERGHETRKDLRLATAVRLVSYKLGVTGVADMVEFHLAASEFDSQGKRIAAKMKGASGNWSPFPVEYKHGKPKAHRADEVQLCAQAICLEEMLNVSIPRGALFYGQPRRRTEVTFDGELRNLTRTTAEDVHRLMSGAVTPPAEYTKACEACSIIEECRPKLISSGKSAKKWIEKTVVDLIG